LQLMVSARKLLVSLICLIWRSYSCTCITHRAVRFEVNALMQRKVRALLSVFNSILWPNIKILNLSNAKKKDKNSCSITEYRLSALVMPWTQCAFHPLYLSA
jgi:fucose permease